MNYFYLYLMFHTYTVRFDVMENFKKIVKFLESKQSQNVQLSGVTFLEKTEKRVEKQRESKLRRRRLPTT